MTIKNVAYQYHLRLRHDQLDDTTIIPGREGRSHIFEYSDDLLGVMIMPETGTAHRWRLARAAFESAGMVIRQSGDCEGTASFDANDPEQLRIAMKYAMIRPIRRVSEGQKQRLRELGKLRQNASTLAVGSELTR